MLSKGLNLIWSWSEKFPGAVPVTIFKEYIARVQFDTDYYYTAYPHATANDVKSAHIVAVLARQSQSSRRPMRPSSLQGHTFNSCCRCKAILAKQAMLPSRDRGFSHAQQERQRLRTDDPLADHRR